MSQQSNPATLREVLEHVLAIENFHSLDSVHYDGKSVREIVVAALAASGTEATPCGVCNAPREIAGGEHVCGLSASEAYSLGFARGFSSQAVVSPEVEGREAFAAKIELGATDTLVGRREHGDTRTTFQRVAEEISRLRELVRQSAAPSGGVAEQSLAKFLHERIAAAENSPLKDPAEDYCEDCLIDARNWLAQESQTGAVTETK